MFSNSGTSPVVSGHHSRGHVDSQIAWGIANKIQDLHFRAPNSGTSSFFFRSHHSSRSVGRPPDHLAPRRRPPARPSRRPTLPPDGAADVVGAPRLTPRRLTPRRRARAHGCYLKIVGPGGAGKAFILMIGCNLGVWGGHVHFRALQPTPRGEHNVPCIFHSGIGFRLGLKLVLSMVASACSSLLHRTASARIIDHYTLQYKRIYFTNTCLFIRKPCTYACTPKKRQQKKRKIIFGGPIFGSRS